MCKTKKRTDAISPKRRSLRSPRSSSTTTSVSSTTDFTTNSTSLHFSNTSTSTRASLSSIRESLPENPNIYAFSEISMATNNFLSQPLRSSSATWRCSIRGKDAVITRCKFRRQIEPSDLRDRLSKICRSHYGSLINLLGASISNDHIYLVYEYVNGSDLASCLRSPRNPNYTVLSTWMSRMQIATDLAQGLEYIHHYSGLDLCLIHNRIKSRSVIITEPNFNAKICLFGAAILSGETSISSNSVSSSSSADKKLKRSDSRGLKIEGTKGYMPPEFLAAGIVSQKSDIFALGIVFLEILSGKEPLKYTFDESRGEYTRVSLIESAREAIDTGRTREWVDRRLRDSFPEEVAESMVRVALDCVHEDADERPDMRAVSGKVSRMYLESSVWSETVRFPTEFTASLAPR